LKIRDLSNGEKYSGALEVDFVEPGLEPEGMEEDEFYQAYESGAVLVTGLPEEMKGKSSENFAFRIDQRPNPFSYEDPVEKLASIYGENDPRTQQVEYWLNSGIEDRLT
jgi:hypothetical protein